MGVGKRERDEVGRLFFSLICWLVLSASLHTEKWCVVRCNQMTMVSILWRVFSGFYLISHFPLTWCRSLTVLDQAILWRTFEASKFWCAIFVWHSFSRLSVNYHMSSWFQMLYSLICHFLVYPTASWQLCCLSWISLKICMYFIDPESRVTSGLGWRRRIIESDRTDLFLILLLFSFLFLGHTVAVVLRLSCLGLFLLDTPSVN